MREVCSVCRDSNSRTCWKQSLKTCIGINVIVGMESRGYYFGIPLAFALKLPFVPLRKPGMYNHLFYLLFPLILLLTKTGKLPGDCMNVAYGLEYGENKFAYQDKSASVLG